MNRLSRFRALAAMALILGFPASLFALNAPLPSEWLRDLKKGAEQGKSKGKRILAVFSGERCGPCQRMVKAVYPTQEVRDALKDWVPVYMEYEETPDVFEKYKVSSFPTFILFSSDLQEEDRTVGGRSAEDFVKLLKNHAGFVESLRGLKARVEKDPKDAKAWSELGRIYIDRDNFEAGVEAFEKAVSNDPEDKLEIADDLYFYKSVPQGAEDLAEAEPKFSSFEQKFPKSPLLPKVLLIRAMILFETHADANSQKLDFGKVDKAIALLKEGIEKYPSHEATPQMRQMLRQIESYAKEYAPDDGAADQDSEKKGESPAK